MFVPRCFVPSIFQERWSVYARRQAFYSGCVLLAYSLVSCKFHQLCIIQGGSIGKLMLIWIMHANSIFKGVICFISVLIHSKLIIWRLCIMQSESRQGDIIWCLCAVYYCHVIHCALITPKWNWWHCCWPVSSVNQINSLLVVMNYRNEIHFPDNLVIF